MPTVTRTSRLPASGGGLITKSVLPGGLRIITEAMPGARSASIGVWVGVGSADEAPTVAGASHYLEHLLFKGTAARSALDIAAAIDAVGGELNAFTEKEHTCFYATVLDRDLPLAIDVVTDVVLNATVTEQDVDVERAVVLEEIAMRDDEPSDLVFDEFAIALLGDTPFGRPVLGTVASISVLRRSQVAGYYRRRYQVPRMVVALAGAVQHRHVVTRVRRAFGDRLGGSAEPADVRHGRFPSAAPAQPTRVVTQDSEQANLVLGLSGLSRHDDRRFAQAVLSTVLGGGMSSRLFQHIREDRGLAYSVHSFTSQFAAGGIFGLYAGCQPGKTDEVLALMNAELADLAAHGLTAAEVERGKGQVRGATILGLEEPASRMTRIGKSELGFGDVIGVDEVLARIDAVSAADVADVAAYLLSRPRCLTVVGPFGAHDFDGATNP
ncbi:MAG TPA: pitrilysin family protein [Jatrophihabitantaceae bacterium]|jgi:predicted Zn-dependent peptidase|nr:pitrilysin family protein [Jatrophihabitantaceae bacterium]